MKTGFFWLCYQFDAEQKTKLGYDGAKLRKGQEFGSQYLGKLRAILNEFIKKYLSKSMLELSQHFFIILK